MLQPQLGSTNMGQHMPLLTATPRLNTALAYATASAITDIQTQMLQPVICAADTKSAIVSTTVVCMPTNTVPYCTTVSQLTGSTTNVVNSNATQMCENVAIDSTPAMNLGIPQNI